MTLKQEKLVKLITENYRTEMSTKTLKQLLLEAGYSESTSLEAARILESETVQEGIRPVVSELEEIRQKALEVLKRRDPETESYKDIVSAIDVITKNIQLLSDKPTDITKNQEIESLRLEIKEWIKPKETNV